MPVRGVDCSNSKGGSCIPWNLTLPKEAYRDVLIRSDLLLICRDLFPTAVCFGGEQNREGYETSKQTISTQVGWGHYIYKLIFL